MIPMKIIFHEDQIAAITSDYNDGSSLEILGPKYGCSPETIRNVLRRSGVTLRPPGLRPSPILPTKRCTSCGLDKDRSEFSRRGRRDSQCKACISIKTAERYATDTAFRKKVLASSAQTYQANIDKIKNCLRKRWSGWTHEQFQRAWQSQNGLCDICSVPMRPNGVYCDSVCADHDHVTGKQRSLLCAKCNKLLGVYEKNKSRFDSYLERWGNGGL
jgi:hypothetical protein